MMNAHGAGSRDEAMMSDAAEQALEELLEERRDQVLEVARRASPNEILTAADVVRAYYSSEPRRTAPVTLRPPATRRSSRWPWWGVGGGLTGLLSLLLATYTFEHSSSTGSQNFLTATPLTSVVLGATGVAVLLSLLFVRRVADIHASKLRVASRVERSVHKTGEVVLNGSGGDPINEADEASLFLYKWSQVEDRLRRLANSLDKVAGRQPMGRQPIGEVIATLLVHRVIDDAFSVDLRKVVGVRNKVAHGEYVHPEPFQEGVSLLHTVEDRIDKLEHGIKPTA